VYKYTKKEIKPLEFKIRRNLIEIRNRTTRTDVKYLTRIIKNDFKTLIKKEELYYE